MTDATETQAAALAARTQPELPKPKLSPLDLSHVTPEMLAALALAQSRAQTIGKDAKHDQRGYNYATAEAMIRGSRATMTGVPGEGEGLGLAIVSGWTSDPLPRPLEVGNQTITCVITEHWAITHESGGYIQGTGQVHVVESRGRARDKAEMAALTYMHGFVLRQILNMDRAEEGEHAVDARDDDRERDPFEGEHDRGPRRPPRAPRGHDPGDPPRAGSRRVVRSDGPTDAPRQAASQGPDYKAQLGVILRTFLNKCEKVTGVRREWHDVLSEAIDQVWPAHPTTEQMQEAIRKIERDTKALDNPPPAEGDDDPNGPVTMDDLDTGVES